MKATEFKDIMEGLTQSQRETINTIYQELNGLNYAQLTAKKNDMLYIFENMEKPFFYKPKLALIEIKLSGLGG